MLGPTRRDVDVVHGQVRVVQQAQEVTDRGRVVLEPKSGAGRRRVELPASTLKVLERHLGRYAEPGPDGAVFTGVNGGPLRRATLSAAWRKACAAAGAPAGLRIHDLRHHAATLTARTPGVTTKELMARIGHSTPRAALIHRHATAERDRRIAEFIDDELAKVTVPEDAPVATSWQFRGNVDPGCWSVPPAHTI